MGVVTQGQVAVRSGDMKRYWWKAALCTAALATLAACANDHPAPSSELQVKVGLFGGPPLTSGGMALSNAPQPGATVVVANSKGRKWTAQTGRDGVAKFSLRPGEYAVTSLPCAPEPQTVAMKPGQLSHVQIIVCNVP